MIVDGGFKTADDIYAYLKDMFKDALQEMLEAELEVKLGYGKGDRKNKETENKRNGYANKTIKTKYGELDINVPRDRNGEFEPIVVPKNKRDISGIEEKVISLYASG
ncbi:transposase, partial [Paramaledivibacter caminithermalis]